MNYDDKVAAYLAHRRIHPGVLRELCSKARIGDKCRVLEVGCGPGHYVRAVAAHTGCKAYGLDLSEAMLVQAIRLGGTRTWTLGHAEHLCFKRDAFDLIFSVDVIHHLLDGQAFFRHVARTLCAGGRVCTVTDSPEIIRSRPILSGYFPETVDVELARYPSVNQITTWMSHFGLTDVQVVNVEARCQVTSGQPFRDRAYSSLHLISIEALRAGLERLERDLAVGPIESVSRYACIWGHK